MHRSVAEEAIDCPFCGENLTVLIDLSVESQSYIEDCQVCCCPIQLSYAVTDEDTVNVEIDCAS